MTLYVPLWACVAGTLVIAFLVARAVSQPEGPWDFVSPLIGAAIFGATVVFWVAFFIGRLT